MMTWLKLTFAVTLLGFAHTGAFAQDSITVVPETAHFDVENLEASEQQLIGSLGIRRLFLGTRSEKQYQDKLELYSFDGERLKLAKFTDPATAERFLEQLAGGYRIPVVVTATVESTRAGHDGVNIVKREIPNISKCEPTTVEAISYAAKAAKIEQSAVDDFKSSLEPDAVKDDIAISIGRVYVGSKSKGQESKVSISDLRIFNPTEEPAKIEIKNVTVKQNDASVTAKYTGEKKWEVESQSWADGIYEKGKTPKRLFAFVPEKPLNTNEPATVILHLTVNGKDVSVEKAYTPR